MNAVWTLAEEHRNLFPGDTNPGLTATRDALWAVLGLPIDYTTIIDLKGFRTLVDAMGGVDVNVRGASRSVAATPTARTAASPAGSTRARTT